MRATWEAARKEIVSYYQGKLSEWHPGKTPDGRKTYDYTGQRYLSIEYDMSMVIEEALANGNFGHLDDIYVRLVEGTQRHTQHGTGPPKPTQACAKPAKGVKQGQRRKTSERTSRTVVRRRGMAKKQRLYVCKRRFPRQRRSMGAIVPDPHNPTIHQVFLERNDCLLNGCE